MAALKDIKRKIGAVKKTQQITRAMNMVAAARLRTAQTRMENFRPYAAKFSEVMGNLASRIQPDIHPFLVQPDTVTRVELVAFSSDKGLCGSFNTNIINGVERFIAQRKTQNVAVSLTLVGRKLRDYFRRRPVNIRVSYTETMNSYNFADASLIAQGVSNSFLTGEVDEVWIYYTRFESMARQAPTLVKLLPISPPEAEDESDQGAAGEYLCEPSAEAIMIDLLPKSFTIQVYNAMLETSTSENAARMMAMDNATNNCADMIVDLTMVYNKARQAAITMELIDIVGGVEALKS